MKAYNKLVDNDLCEWEFRYEEVTRYERDEATGAMEPHSTVVRDLRYRVVGSEGEWLTLPPWADIADEWKVNLCLFDEDEETGELTFWQLVAHEGGGSDRSE